MISVVLPTVPGREEVFAQVAQAYRERTAELELIVVYDMPTVGCAWQAGAEKAHGDYIHLGNDDCEPHPGWWEPAVQACDGGYLPSPQVFGSDGMPQGLPEWGRVAADWTPVHCAMIPFMSRVQWDKVQPLFLGHYYTDNFITHRAQRAGYPCRLRTGYAFTHHWAQQRRGAGLGSEQARHVYDRPLYEQALLMSDSGQWTEPWPPGGRAVPA